MRGLLFQDDGRRGLVVVVVVVVSRGEIFTLWPSHGEPLTVTKLCDLCFIINLGLTCNLDFDLYCLLTAVYSSICANRIKPLEDFLQNREMELL